MYDSNRDARRSATLFVVETTLLRLGPFKFLEVELQAQF